MKAKALVKECQDTQAKTRAQVDIKFPQHQKYPTHKQPIKVPSIIVERNEDILSNESPLLMDRMFEEDLIMERL